MVARLRPLIHHVILDHTCVWLDVYTFEVFVIPRAVEERMRGRRFPVHFKSRCPRACMIANSQSIRQTHTYTHDFAPPKSDTRNRSSTSVGFDSGSDSGSSGSGSNSCPSSRRCTLPPRSHRQFRHHHHEWIAATTRLVDHSLQVLLRHPMSPAPPCRAK